MCQKSVWFFCLKTMVINDKRIPFCQLSLTSASLKLDKWWRSGGRNQNVAVGLEMQAGRLVLRRKVWRAERNRTAEGLMPCRVAHVHSWLPATASYMDLNIEAACSHSVCGLPLSLTDFRLADLNTHTHPLLCVSLGHPASIPKCVFV